MTRRELVSGRGRTELVHVWTDMALAALASPAPVESVVASDNAWSLLRNDDRVVVQFEYADEGEEPADTIRIDELQRG